MVTDDLQQSKRSRPNTDGESRFFLKMLLPEKEVGNVIGKGGAVLKRICDESGARVRISGIEEVLPGTRERVATISGSLQALLLAQHQVTAALFAARERRADGSRPDTTDADAPMAVLPADKTLVLKLLFPHQSCGVVMGKGGAFIKELMLTTGAQIKVSQPDELIVATQERVITIVGTATAVDAAQDGICVRMAAAPVNQQIKETDYSVFKYTTSPMGGAPPAGFAAYPPRGAPQQQQHPAAMPFKHFMATLADHVTPEQAQHKYGEYLRYLSLHQPATHMMGQGPMGAAQPPRPDAGGPQVKQEVLLSGRVVSGIIGKGGIVIKEMVQRSGAKIHVSPREAENHLGERTVEVSGGAEQVAVALQLINERRTAVEAQALQVQGPGAPQYAAAGALAPNANMAGYAFNTSFGQPQW